MKLKTKLTLLAAVPLLGLVLAVATFYFQTRTFEQAVHLATTESAVFSELAQNLQLNVVQVQQFLSDVSATRGLDGQDDGFNLAVEQRAEFLAGIQQFREMFEREKDAANLKQITMLEAAFASYYETGTAMAATYVKEGTAAGNKLMAAFDQAAAHLTDGLAAFVKQQNDEFKNALAAVEGSSHKAAMAVMIGGLILTVATIWFAIYLVRSITGVLAGVAGQLSEGATQTGMAAHEVSSASQSLAEGASEQAASLEETSASLEEIAAMTKRNSDHAANSKSLSQQASAFAATGLERITEMARTLTAVKGAVGEMESAVSEMQSSSQEIAKIVKTIDEIAFQTNLLALNAAVEAARAGESGAGFAVVADEVRSLAHRSAQAAKDTTEKIEAAVKRSALGGAASQKVVLSLGEIEGSARNIEHVITGIVAQIKSLDEIVGEISAASQEQSQGITEVNMAVGQMDKVTQSNAAHAEENASAAEELNAQVAAIQNIVSRLQAVISGAYSPASPSVRPIDPPPVLRRTSIAKVLPPAKSKGKPVAVPAAPGFRNLPADLDLPMPEPMGKATGGFKNF